MSRRTRQQKADELLQRLTRGPSFSEIPGRPFTQADAATSYRIWSQSWVLDDLVELVPELRRAAAAAKREADAARRAQQELARIARGVKP